MKLLKRLWPIPVLFIISALMIRACAQMIPFNIEPERVRPQAKIELPKVQTVPDAVDYFFEPSSFEIKPGDPYPMVHMRIPKAPYFEKTAKSGPHRDYNMYITMFYPNFSGLADEENRADCFEVAGHCRRQLTVGFGFTSNPNNFTQQAYYNILQEDIKKGYVKAVSGPSKYPNLELFSESEVDETRRTYYVSHDKQGSPEYTIKCNEYVSSPSCETYFRTTKSPYIYVNLTFVLSLLPQWKEVIEATRNKVDSMIIQTYELQTKEQ